MAKMENVGKGIFKYPNADGSTTFYIKIRVDGVLKNIKVGKDTEGINLQYCIKYRDDLMVGIRRGETIKEVEVKHKKLTMDELASAYFESKKTKSSIKNEENRYNTHIKNVFGKRDPNKITANDLQAFQTKKLEEVAHRTSQHIIGLIRTILNFGMKQKLIKAMVNPYDEMERIKGEDTHRDRYLTLMEINELLDAVKDDEILNLFVRLSLRTGGRRNTILTIKVNDIDFNQKIVTLVDHKKQNNQSTSAKSKYKGFLTDDDIEMIKNHIHRYNLKSSSYLVSTDGKMRNGDAMSSKLQPILNDLFNVGLDTKDTVNRIVVHSLRHTFASHLAINGTPIFTIQKLMNHSSIQMTMRYAHLAPDSGKEFVNALYR